MPFSPSLHPAVTVGCALLGAGVLSACGDGIGPGGQQTVSLSVATTASSGAQLHLPGGGLVIDGGADVLVITRAQLVLREIELESPDFICGSRDDDGSNDDDDCEIEYGPRLIELPLDGSVAAVVNVAVPEGAYREIELKLHKPDDDDAEDLAFIAAHPDFRRISVRVEGTFNGEPFVYTTDESAELELEFRPPLVVDATGVNITVDIGLATWFRHPAGGLLRPSAANADLIDANIRGSFRAFEDDDRDGDDDRS